MPILWSTLIGRPKRQESGVTAHGAVMQIRLSRCCVSSMPWRRRQALADKGIHYISSVVNLRLAVETLRFVSSADLQQIYAMWKESNYTKTKQNATQSHKKLTKVDRYFALWWAEVTTASTSTNQSKKYATACDKQYKNEIEYMSWIFNGCAWIRCSWHPAPNTTHSLPLQWKCSQPRNDSNVCTIQFGSCGLGMTTVCTMLQTLSR